MKPLNQHVEALVYRERDIVVGRVVGFVQCIEARSEAVVAVGTDDGYSPGRQEWRQYVTARHVDRLARDNAPLGVRLDAAIVEGYKDLSFVNPYSYPIMLKTSSDNGVLTVSIVKAG